MKINFDTTLKVFLAYILTPFIGFLLVAYVSGFASKAEVDSLSVKVINIDNKTDKIEKKLDRIMEIMLEANR